MSHGSRFDREALRRHGESLSELANDLSSDTVHDWVSGDSERARVLSGTVWGVVRWEKSLGRPEGSALAGGFSIKHFHWFETFVVLAGGAILEKQGWLPVDDVSSWDLSEESQHYRIGFMCRSFGLFPNKISVDFALNHGWIPEDIRFTGPRIITPHEQVFGSDQEGVTVLDEFEVVEAVVMDKVVVGAAGTAH
jgi:hypothetical protein